MYGHCWVWSLVATNGHWQRALTPDSRCYWHWQWTGPRHPVFRCSLRHDPSTTEMRAPGQSQGCCWSHWRAPGHSAESAFHIQRWSPPTQQQHRPTAPTTLRCQPGLYGTGPRSKCLNIGLVGDKLWGGACASEDLNNYLQITKYSPWNKSQYKSWGGTWEADSIICSRLPNHPVLVWSWLNIYYFHRRLLTFKMILSKPPGLESTRPNRLNSGDSLVSQEMIYFLLTELCTQG